MSSESSPLRTVASIAGAIAASSLSYLAFMSLTGKNTTNTAALSPADIVVVGSANADIYIEVPRIPKVGETLDGELTLVGPGGKGSNQAGAAALSALPGCGVKFIGNLGDDAHAKMFTDIYTKTGVDFSQGRVLSGVPTGQAYILLDSNKQNSIIIALGANEVWTEDRTTKKVLSESQLQSLYNAKCVLLQREIPDDVNLFVAQECSNKNVPVFLDMGGRASPLSHEIFPFLTLLSMNETELGRLAGVDVELQVTDGHIAIEPFLSAVAALHAQGLRRMLITLGEHGALLFSQDEEPVVCTSIAPVKLVDTTGAGDCYRANFAVAFSEGQSYFDSMRFAAAASSLCIEKLGTLISMPQRAEILARLHQ